jgi:hypothetical protein
VDSQSQLDCPSRQEVGPDIVLAGDVRDHVAEETKLERPPLQLADCMLGQSRIPAQWIADVGKVAVIGVDEHLSRSQIVIKPFIRSKYREGLHFNNRPDSRCPSECALS